jgi:hypothetical protein
MLSLDRSEIPEHLLRFFEPRHVWKQKDDLMIPHRVYQALMQDGWYGRMDVVWAKSNPMPESVTDRPTKAHEYLFLLSKGPRYYWDADAIREDALQPVGIPRSTGQGKALGLVGSVPGHRNGVDGSTLGTNQGAAGRNKRSVWTVATAPFSGAHFAVFPPKLIEPCILAGSSPKACGVCGAPWRRLVEVESRPNWQGNGNQKHDGTYYRENIGGVGNDRRARVDRGWEPSCGHNDDTGQSVVLDPFTGAGTTGVVAAQLGRQFVGCELNPAYAEMARERIALEGRPGGKPATHQPSVVADGQIGLFGGTA